MNAFSSRAAFSRPFSRSACAPWIATAPNTAIAPVAATPIARERAALSSIPATCGTAPVSARARFLSSTQRHVQREREQRAASAAISSHHPEDRLFGRGQQDRGGRRQAQRAPESDA